MLVREIRLFETLSINDNERNRSQEHPLLHRITVPQSGAAEILNYVHRYGINAAKLFPGYDGVVRSIEENELLSVYLNNQNDITQ
jgi:predicted nuclease of restriction endonuclease-like RecB superfamily